MTKTVLALTSLRPNEDEALATYLAVVGPLMDRAGAKLVARYQVSDNLSSSDAPEFVSLVEYPNADAIRMVFDDPDYVGLRAIREKAFARYEVCVLEHA